MWGYRAMVGGATAGDGNLFASEGDRGDWGGIGQIVSQGKPGAVGSRRHTLGDSGFEIRRVRDGNSSRATGLTLRERGIWVEGSHTEHPPPECVFDNAGRGTWSTAPGHRAPAIILDAARRRRTACPGCTVELFLDAGNQGRRCLATVIADAAGAFAVPKSCPVIYPNLTAA